MTETTEKTGHYSIGKMLGGAGRAVKQYDEILDRLGLGNFRIDEIAYMFPTVHHLDAFTKEAVREDGCILFNTADDHVHTEPLKTCYNVEYRFFTVPMRFLDTMNEVRVEAMHVKNGYSPLHSAEWWNAPSAPALAVHASFKCKDEDEYGAVTHALRSALWEPAQKCDSTYGRFSYWTPGDREDWFEDGAVMYLKPRVNLRDEGEGSL